MTENKGGHEPERGKHPGQDFFALFRFSTKRGLYLSQPAIEKDGPNRKTESYSKQISSIARRSLPFLTLLVLIVNAIIYAQQCNLMHRQATIMATQQTAQEHFNEGVLPVMQAQATAAKTAADAAKSQADAAKIQAQAAKDAANSARQSVQLTERANAAQLVVIDIERVTPKEPAVLKVANTGHSNAIDVRIRSVPVQEVGNTDFDPWKMYEKFETVENSRLRSKWTAEDEAWWKSILKPEQFARFKKLREEGSSELSFDSVVAEIYAGQVIVKSLPIIPPESLVNVNLPSHTAIVGFLSWKDELSGTMRKGPLFCFEYIPGLLRYSLCAKAPPEQGTAQQ